MTSSQKHYISIQTKAWTSTLAGICEKLTDVLLRWLLLCVKFFSVIVCWVIENNIFCGVWCQQRGKVQKQWWHSIVSIAAANENVLMHVRSSVCVRGEGAEANADHDGTGRGEPAGWSYRGSATKGDLSSNKESPLSKTEQRFNMNHRAGYSLKRRNCTVKLAMVVLLCYFFALVKISVIVVVDNNTVVHSKCTEGKQSAFLIAAECGPLRQYIQLVR